MPSKCRLCIMVASQEVVSRFGGLVSRLEKKPQCKGRSLELFLTYPMHQVGRHIIIIITIITIMMMMTRSPGTSSRCTSCWPTPRQTMWRRTPWSRPGSSWRTSPGRCTTRWRSVNISQYTWFMAWNNGKKSV